MHTRGVSEEIAVMPRLIAAVCAICLMTACGSGPPTAPTTITQSRTSSPTGNSGGGPDAIAAASVAAGTLVEGSIDGDDPVCFRNWDASGRCRQFDVTAPADGRLLATLRWVGSPRGLYDPDVFIVAPDGAWAFSDQGWPEKYATLPARRSLTYRIVVMAYGPSDQPFQLIAVVE
jgi:hypothetical protein